LITQSPDKVNGKLNGKVSPVENKLKGKHRGKSPSSEHSASNVPGSSGKGINSQIPPS